MSTPREYITRSYRTFPDSSIRLFGQWIGLEEWEELNKIVSPTIAVENFENLMSQKIEDYFPLKFSRAPITDKPWISKELSQLSRRKMREYEKNGKSSKYIDLRDQFNRDLKLAISNYRQKQLDSVKNSTVKTGYFILKKMGARLGEEVSNDLILPCHEDLTPQEIAEDIADHFSSISNEYKPFQWSDLPPEINKKVEEINSVDIPQVSDLEVYNKILTAKKTKSNVPGDLPKRLIQEFSVEISSPLATIFNKALQHGEYPKDWKIEYGTAIPKIPNPETLDDTRLISLTKFTSKIFESFLVQWILEIVGPDLDPSQFGGLKGNSITHLLIHLINFILANLDSPEPTAVLAAIIDFSKAFNRMSHARIIKIMDEIGLPGWMLKLLASYLSERVLIVRYKGSSSSKRKMPGGAPQGTVLGVITFIIQMIGAKAFPVIELAKIITAPGDKQPNIASKFIDDLTTASVIKLKTSLQIQENQERPTTYHGRTDHFLPDNKNPVIDQLNFILDFAKQNQMKLNIKKTNLMLFHRSRKYDFQPIISLEDKQLDVVEESKILGVIISSDMKWEKNVNYIVKKFMKKLWMLRRIKQLGGTIEEHYLCQSNM